ncbi:flagellar basal body rod protein FlgB [Chitinilyticum piscinae]|uniref:Flagellar basal body rod protein FlgB n=1 Tax=Chitinilyticum piscinae TaxID=2866724 RepID=A0A8J7FMB8_9NEIS|nr:flagellar basal body rod protein FlgB [Chitinilyticum piscinae]MBE9610772.1 flagellar basal body rod protein FlgB [Chitinilyticum piscinae]
MLDRIDRYFQPQETALKLSAYRQEVLASNIANADTPNYKARDFDFGRAYVQARAIQRGQGGDLKTTDSRHLQPAGGTDPLHPELQYRNPLQPSIDGNTVDMASEMSEFSQNALRYQAAIMFFQRRVEGMRTALTGQ